MSSKTDTDALLARIAELEQTLGDAQAMQQQLDARAGELAQYEEQLAARQQEVEAMLAPMSDSQISERQQQLIAAERDFAERAGDISKREQDVSLKADKMHREREQLEALYESLADRLAEIGQRESTMIDRIRAEQTALKQQRELIERESQVLNRKVREFLQKRSQMMSGGSPTASSPSVPAKPGATLPPSGKDWAAPKQEDSSKSGARTGWFGRKK